MYIIDKPKKLDILKIARRKARKSDCCGCYNNFYNGHNPYGIETCWSLQDARLVRRKRVSVNDIPPWDWQPVVIVPHCYRESGYIHINPRQER